MTLKAIIKNEGFKLTQAMAVRPAGLLVDSQNVIHTARRDWASFAIVLVSDEDVLLSVTDATAFTPKANHLGVRVAVHCPGLRQIETALVGMIDDDDGMNKADIVLRGDAYTLPARQAHQLRLSLNIPAETEAGTYTGTVTFYGHTFFGDEEELCKLEFAVVVHDVTLPEMRERRFHLDLWQHLSNIARKHETPLFTDSHFEVVERYVKTLAELGQRAVTVIASEIPWSGQRCYNGREYMSDLFEYSMIRVTKGRDGSFHYDYSVAERYIRMCFRHGIDREIEVFGLANIWMEECSGYGKAAPAWPDGIRVRYFDEVDGTFRYMHEYEEIANYITALQNYLECQGWLEKTRVVADEPADMEAYSLSLTAIRKAAPKLRFKMAINHAEFIDEFKDVVADYVPMLSAVSAEWDALQHARRHISGRLLYYVCCWPPFPNNFICSPLAEGRLIPLLAAYMNMDGFLRWNYTVWPENPRERLTYRTGEWWSGDTCFVYPSKGGEPLLSLRYYVLKRGIEDYELAMMVAARSNGAQVLGQIWDTIIRQKDMRLWQYDMQADTSGMYSSAWDDYERVRFLLLSALEG